jgi:hypothetical protein
MNNLYFCAIFASFYATNCFALLLSSQLLHEICIAFGVVFYLTWFHSFGYKHYLNTNLQRSLNLFISFTSVIVIQIIEQKLTNSYFLSMNSIAAVLLTIIIVSITIIRYS